GGFVIRVFRQMMVSARKAYLAGIGPKFFEMSIYLKSQMLCECGKFFVFAVLTSCCVGVFIQSFLMGSDVTYQNI
ncbi:MAG: hypothetical protein KGY42_02920, partial [Desulfobacterales bacterium]|nr:hypothetical protein [Desulfobacterales bacterium]